MYFRWLCTCLKWLSSFLTTIHQETTFSFQLHQMITRGNLLDINVGGIPVIYKNFRVLGCSSLGISKQGPNDSLNVHHLEWVGEVGHQGWICCCSSNAKQNKAAGKKNLPFGSLLHLSPGNHGLILKLNSLNKGWLTAGLVVITHLLTAYGKNHYPVHAGGRLLFRVVFGCCV